MKRIIRIACFLISLAAGGQVPEFEWAVQLGGAFGASGNAIATDTFGNVYTTGSFSNNNILSDTADFDPGSDFYGLVSNGEADIFISKLSPDGDLDWAVSFGNTEDDRGHGITTDADGNVYVTGLYHSGIDFDPGPDIYYLSGSPNYSSVFILKLDTNGSFVWARRLGGVNNFSSSGSSWAYSIAVDDLGNVYTTGRANDGGDFDPGPEEYILTNGTNTSSIFISKLDSDGNFVWAKAIGGEEPAQSYAVALDDFNNVFITGVFSGTTDFDPGLNEYTLSAIGTGDLFIVKLNNNGNFIWVNNVGGDSTIIWGISLILDEIGNIYTTGLFLETIDFDPGVANYELSAIEADIFILKLGTNGNFVWAKSIGGSGYDISHDIALDQFNSVYITGVFKETIDFDPGSGTYNLFAISEDAYVLKLDAEGSFVWAGSFSGSNNSIPFGDDNVGNSIAIDKWDNIYITGHFGGTTDFDPNSSVFGLISNGNANIFIQKMRQRCNANFSINTANNNFTICAQESITLNAALLSFIEDISYYWNIGDTSNYVIVAPDSTSTYSLSVSYFDAGLDMECTFYDSVVVTVLAIPDTTYLNFSTCDSLEAGMVAFIFPSQYGCDSIVQVTNSLMPILDAPVTPPDIVIQVDEPPFQISVAEVPNATEYLWTLPPGVELLSGVGTSSITIDWNGLTTGGNICVSAINECGSSPVACMNVTVDIMDAIKEIGSNDYRLFPNPVDEALHIIFEEANHYEIVLLDVLSRKMRSIKTHGSSVQIGVDDLVTGTYWLRISKGVSSDRVYWERVLIK